VVGFLLGFVFGMLAMAFVVGIIEFRRRKPHCLQWGGDTTPLSQI